MAIDGVRALTIFAAMAVGMIAASDLGRCRRRTANRTGASKMPTRSACKPISTPFPGPTCPKQGGCEPRPLDHQADRFDHIRHLEDANHLSGGAPNNDTLYSRAWVYLKDEPVILTVPADRRSLLHDGDRRLHGRQFRLCRHARDRDESRKLRDRRSRLERDAAGWRQGAAALLDAVGHDPRRAPT